MLDAPIPHRIDHRFEGTAVVGQRVLYAKRLLVDDLAFDEPVFLQVLEAVGEHPARDAVDGVLEFVDETQIVSFANQNAERSGDA
ncbi:hypothetical protein SAMN05192561_1013 [Halopenitus malekzadehii]|uniref:Uncharacterized protein n=1 Tax=Halopenitus malekzadehii TaxID=1267564 RepID=A0A1H6HQK0_9EURY|nr:hypothetical protein SAMN05192561_1013 [Halopenitus malekzadehii]